MRFSVGFGGWDPELEKGWRRGMELNHQTKALQTFP
jgi:hypothetical protein